MRSIAFFVCMLVMIRAGAQIKTPVQWDHSVKKIAPDTYELHIKASIEKGWHIYSQTTPEGGPLRTTVKFSQNPLVTLSGPAKEIGKLEQHHEKLFGVDVKQFSNVVDFVQTVVLKKPVKTKINGSIEFMVCNDEECLPPATVKFTLTLD